MLSNSAVIVVLIAVIISGCLSQGLISQALFLGNMTNTTRHDCVWRRGNDRDSCPDPDVKYYFYSSAEPGRRKLVNLAGTDWLRTNGWNSDHDTVILIHGYAGMDGSLPMVVLKDAYLRNGSYNVFTVDWGPLSQPPCYMAALHNMRPVARCVSGLFTFLRNGGALLHRTTCVGHSLGAHMCGLASTYLLFKMHRIIGLDPARPLVRGANKLRNVDANIVQVIHTNAGQFGEAGRLGVIDFCINGGREQPFCVNKTNVALCSHVRSVCYMAESINTATARVASPCSTRRCLSGSRHPVTRLEMGLSVIMGQHTPGQVLQIAGSQNVEQWTGERLEWDLGSCTLQIYESCDDTKIRFLLYPTVYESGSEPVLLRTQDPDPSPGIFDPNLPTKVVIHGYAGHAEFNTTAVIRQAYLSRGNLNLIVVDWGPLANHPCYFSSTFNVWQVGACTAQMLLGLAARFPLLHMTSVHALGFSLGAHVAAVASNGVREAIGSSLGRITGLDPALPLFATLNDAWKLDPDDADFVDVIHTNVGVFGKAEASGHADFFVNGGSFQPACAGHRNVPLCSHLLASVYFAESVVSETGFWGSPCPSYWQYVMGWCAGEDVPDHQKMLMGEECSGIAKGVFFVETRDFPPYALGKHQDSNVKKIQ